MGKVPIKGVLFDMDGVLVDSEWFYNRRRIAYLENKGFLFDEIPDLSGSNDKAIWDYLVPSDFALREELKNGYESYADAHPLPLNELLNKDAAIVFSQLHARGIKTAIASSSPQNAIDKLIQIADLADALDFVISGHSCRAFKPDPEIYIRAMGALHLLPEETLVVEDSPLGIEAGKRAGCRVLALRQRNGVRLDQQSADRVIDSLTEVLNCL